MKYFTGLLCIAALIFQTGCSTRQVIDPLSGSTAQRLVTLSVDKLVKELPEAPLNQLQGQKTWMETHFIKDDPVLEYATARLKTEIEKRHKVVWVEDIKEAEKIVNVFFTSLGTDQDSFGLSIPIPTVTTQSNEIARVDLFALNMYHGISEMYYYVQDASSGEVAKSDVQKANIRTDKLALPIITIPVSTLP